MSSRSLIKLPNTLASRLTIWYAVIFVSSYVAAFVIFSLLVSPVLKTSIDRDLLAEVRDFSSLLSSSGIEAEEVEPYLRIQATNDGVDKKFYRLIAADGKIVASSDLSSWRNLDVNWKVIRRLTQRKTPVFDSRVLPEREKGVRIIYGSVGPGIVLEVGRSLDEAERVMGISRITFGMTLLGLMIVAPVVGWFMARRALMGVEEVRDTAAEISAGSLEKRVLIKKRGDEIERLAVAFNQMVDRIQALINGMREVTDNIAHDLRSPITRIRGMAEMALTTGKSLDDYKSMAVNTIEETDRLLQMVNTMLDISAVESGVDRVDMREIHVSEVVRRACDLFQPISDSRQIAISQRILDKCYIFGELPKIERMVANLLDNALKYSKQGGVVAVTVGEGVGDVEISCADTGVGISEEDLPHIFERFYRCDRSRSHAGVGLGLSLARAIARAHGGDITATSRLNEGSIFVIRLPKARVTA